MTRPSHAQEGCPLLLGSFKLDHMISSDQSQGSVSHMIYGLSNQQ